MTRVRLLLDRANQHFSLPANHFELNPVPRKRIERFSTLPLLGFRQILASLVRITRMMMDQG